MKKLSALVLSFALLIAGLIFAAPAQASETKQQAICHFDSGQGGKYTQNLVSKRSIVKKNGDEGGHGNHDQDIIPPFTWDDGGNDYASYPGLNWTTENQALWAANCEPNTNPLTPALAQATIQATCIDPTASAAILNISRPAQPANVFASDPVLNRASQSYDITFTKSENTLYNKYVWAAGVLTTQSIKILSPLKTDPLWDTAAGQCRMPDTGAGGISNTALMLGGGAIGLGMVFLGITGIMKRRENK